VDPRIRRKRRQRLTVTILVTVLLLLTASAFAVWSYVSGLNTKLNRVVVEDSALASQLNADAPKISGDPFYMVLMGDDRRPGEKMARSDTLILARIDPGKKKVQLISIPRDSRVDIPGYSAPQKINAASTWGGPALTIKTVKQLTGLPISHYLTVDFAGLRGVVDAMGGVWIDVKVRIDENHPDTAWGRKYRVIEKGYQKLDGYHALTFVRARHAYADGDFSRMKNQQLFLKALAKQALSISSVVMAPKIIAVASDNITTDMSIAQIAALATQFRGMNESDLEATTAPAKNAFIDGQSFVIIDEVQFTKMLDRMKKGEPLELVKVAKGSKTATATAGSAPAVKPADITLTVRNGAGVSGLAKTAADLFIKAGFAVKESGNMNQFVYSKTLVVFKKGTDSKAAVVRDELGYGDVVPAAGLYQFNTDVLVVVGKDWKLTTTR
jgi:LCP family protein required for cell wall assembly